MRRLEASGVDIVMLTSSSTADSLCDLLGERARELLRDVLVASIGPITGSGSSTGWAVWLRTG